MSEKESGIIPKILEERLLITSEDRILLKVASELSPHDNGKLLITSSILDNYVPSISKIAEKTGKTNEEVKESFERISKVWNIPSESLPKNNGYYSDEEIKFPSDCFCFFVADRGNTARINTER